MVTAKPELPADSFEVWRDLNLSKMYLLEERLQKLNLQDNPCEIYSICNEIMLIKGMMKIKLRSLERK